MTKKPHKHAEAIHAYADGAEIQMFDESDNCWRDILYPIWRTSKKYRIKPEVKPATTRYYRVSNRTYGLEPCEANNGCGCGKDDLRLTFDTETNKLLKAEVLP